MEPLTAARLQMELSLGFHMIFAAIGMAMPVMMLNAERRWMRTGDADALALARIWSRLTAVTFAIGAVSGTALSFELGLLWPGFMAFAGPLIGPAFALEGYAFFVEAIFLGLYLYGWERLTAMQHWLCGWAVAISGALSGILVLAANAWMQHPVGFRLSASGAPIDVDPWAVLLNPAWPIMALHSTLSTYQAVGFAVAGTYAWRLWRHSGRARYCRLGIAIGMATASVAAVAQPVVGDLLAKRAHVHQPAKLAAMEGQFRTERGAPLRVGGIPDVDARETRYAIEIPRALSVLAANDPNAEVVGLDRFPRDEWPNVVVTHVAFQIMVGAGMIMLGVALWYWGWRWRVRGGGLERPLSRWLLAGLIGSAPAARPLPSRPRTRRPVRVTGPLMALEAFLSSVMLAVLIVYAVLGGADFGAGVWDLLSYGRRGAAHRRALAEAIGPVWEANHVWLIFLIVLLFTCFPSAYAQASVALFWPLHLVLVGIVLRGAAFVFRAYGSASAVSAALWGRVFGAASVITPVLLGMCLASVSTGAMETGSATAHVAWLGAFPLSTGVLALLICAYLAAVYLAWEAKDVELREEFHTRALLCWLAAGAASVATLVIARTEAPRLWSNLMIPPALGLVSAGALLAPWSLWALWRRRFGYARVLGASQVAALLLGWGVAQWPYLIYPNLTIDHAAAPPATLGLIAATLPLGIAALLPSLWFLFSVFKGRNPQT